MASFSIRAMALEKDSTALANPAYCLRVIKCGRNTGETGLPPTARLFALHAFVELVCPRKVLVLAALEKLVVASYRLAQLSHFSSAVFLNPVSHGHSGKVKQGPLYNAI